MENEGEIRKRKAALDIRVLASHPQLVLGALLMNFDSDINDSCISSYKATLW